MITIYTDGGCSGNPGPGGWAFAVSENGETKDYRSGGEKETTNNKMELTAVIKALEYAKENGESDVIILTDSQYVKNGITQWIHSWKRNGWRTSGKSPVKNMEYWVVLDKLNGEMNVDWQWVKGHAGIDGNEKCDSLVRMETAKFM
ncbi:MAG: ribonuclease HI [Candidatus Ornithospirochaeta sp.]